MTGFQGKVFRFCVFLFLTIVPAFAVDSDGDGLTDDVESRLGSSPFHKDIFVYSNVFIWNGKNMRPRGNFLTIVKAVFAAAPVANPDGTTGINLHVEIGPSIRTNIIIATWDQFDFFKNQYLPAAKRSTHHYCLFVGEINIGGQLGHSGVSRNGQISGAEQVISWSLWATQAGITVQPQLISNGLRQAHSFMNSVTIWDSCMAAEIKLLINPITLA